MRQGSRNLSAKSSSPHRAAAASAHPSISFTIHPFPPFRLDLTVWALRRRPENILDRWDGRIYHRVLLLDGKTGAQTAEVAVEQTGSVARPCLNVTAQVPHPTLELHHSLRATLERMLGATSDLRGFYSFAASQKPLRQLIADFTGLKPPRYPTIFEALLNAISCQQVSLNVGIMLLNRLVENFGRPAPATPSANAGAPRNACPSPADLANLSTGALRALGYSRNKERAILDLSRSVASGELNLESFRELDDAIALETLTSIHGIGRWSAEYALLRGMGRLNIFPGDDVGAWNNLQKHLRLRVRPDYAKTRKLLAPWKNYAGLIYFHFLLDGLRTRGLL
jgi:DNA-3-methyladenine glycosylase II